MCIPVSTKSFIKRCLTEAVAGLYIHVPFCKGRCIYCDFYSTTEGVGEKRKSGDRKRILCRFIEYNILGDSLQLRDDVPYWHTNPEILDVSNNAGSFNASFNTTINGGGAMYLTYKDVNVPTGWVKPLSFIRLGRQVNYDEGIAKVRLIVPHSEGTSNATSNVYPCFYEITYQEMRD